MATKDEAHGETLKEKLKGYADTASAKAWFERNWSRLQALFSDVSLRDFIFEPVKETFTLANETPEAAIRQAITMVAVANAVMAGLPGKMGVGVAVSMALEAWMAYIIASRVGIVLQSPSDIFKYFGLLAGVIVTILFLIKGALGLAFSVFSVIPGLNPLILAELLVTNLVGVLFWVGFEEAKRTGSFDVPWRLVAAIGRETKDLARFQWNILRNNLNPSALRKMGGRLKAWLTGEIPTDPPVLRGQVATAVMMACLMSGKGGAFDAPLEQEFIMAIRDRFPDLKDASVEAIADHMRGYDAEQLAGVVNLVKGKLFERMVAHHENQDGDEWQAHLHEDQSYPGSDVTLVNEATGETVELSLKATDSVGYVQSALLRYPEYPVLTTEEVGALMGDHPDVQTASLSNAELTEVTEQNFEQLLGELGRAETAAGAAAGVAAGTAIGLWPFVVAYLRGRITQEQLEMACVRVLGESGVALAARLSYAALLGPVFAWYLLARGVMGVTRMGAEASTAQHVEPRRLSSRGPQALPA